MLAMDPKDAATADVMRLEGTSKWVAGSQDGFRELVRALEDSRHRAAAEESRSAGQRVPGELSVLSSQAGNALAIDVSLCQTESG